MLGHSFIHSITQSFIKFIDHVQCVLSIEEAAVNKIENDPSIMELIIQRRPRTNLCK